MKLTEAKRRGARLVQSGDVYAPGGRLQEPLTLAGAGSGSCHLARRSELAASSKAELIYVSRTETSWTLPHSGQWIVRVDVHDARRLWTSVSTPVGACWLVSGQVNKSGAITGSLVERIARLRRRDLNICVPFVLSLYLQRS